MIAMGAASHMEALPPGLLDNVGVVGVIILGGWLVLTDRLITRKRHEEAKRDARQQYEDKEHEANEWRTQCRFAEQRAQELLEQNNILARDLVPLVTRFFDAIHPNREEG